MDGNRRSEDDLVAKLRAVRPEDITPQFVSWLSGVIQMTPSNRVRNAAALVIADHRIDGGEGMLIDLIASPHTKGARGTLLYALDEMNAAIPVDMLLKILADETYEARNHALRIFEKQADSLSPSDTDKARTALQKLITSADSETVAAAREAIQAIKKKRRVQLA